MKKLLDKRKSSDKNMRMKNILLILMTIILFIFILIGIIHHFNDRRTYIMNLPQLEDLKSIILRQNNEQKVYHDKETIKKIFNSIGEDRVTKKESIQDYPVSASNVIEVDLYFNEAEKTTIFVYNRGQYYMEQPYNGIYKISTDEYNEIAKYIN